MPSNYKRHHASTYKLHFNALGAPRNAHIFSARACCNVNVSRFERLHIIYADSKAYSTSLPHTKADCTIYSIDRIFKK